MAAIADVCEAERLWLHIDSAYAGVAAMLPEHAHILAGAGRADSLVVNPHKWLFTPFDLSAFFCRRMDVVRQAFSLTPEYLKTPDAARNLMDTGVQLGRRFRSLKLWMILRYFGAEGVRDRLRHHIGLAQEFAVVGRRAPGLRAPRSRALQRRLLPREARAAATWTEAELTRLNEAIMTRVNDSGEVFISHTVLDGRFTLRVAIGNLQTTERHVARAWELVREALAAEVAGSLEASSWSAAGFQRREPSRRGISGPFVAAGAFSPCQRVCPRAAAAASPSGCDVDSPARG